MAEELILGSQAVIYTKQEETYGVPVGASGTDAMFTLSESLTPEIVREDRDDRSGSSDVLERTEGRRSATWEVNKYFLPNGNAVTVPDDNLLWKNLFGHESMGTTSIEYLFATAHDDSLTIRRGIRTGSSDGAAEFQEHVFGAITNRLVVGWGSQGNNGKAQLTFGGMAKKWGFTGNTSISVDGTIQLNSSAVAGVHSVTGVNGKQLSEGSLIYIKGDATTAIPAGTAKDPGKDQTPAIGAGIVVSNANYTTNVFTFTSGTYGATHSTGQAVVAYNPTGVTSGSPITDTMGYLSLDGSVTLIKHLGGQVTVEDNRTLLNEEVGYDSATRAMREGRRNVTFALDFILHKEDVAGLLGDMNNNSSNNIQVTIGAQANKKLKLNMKNTRFDATSPEISDQGMARITMNGVALGTNGNDSLVARIL